MLILKVVYDNMSVFGANILDITDDVMAAKFTAFLLVLASLLLALGYLTQVSVPYTFNAELSITLGCDKYTLDKADVYKEYIADPLKFSGSEGGQGGEGGDAEAAKEKDEEKEGKESMDLGRVMDMFGGEEAAGGDH